MTKVTDLKRDEMAAIVASRCGCTLVAGHDVIRDVFETIAGKLADGGKVRITELGILERVHRSARVGRNPRTKEVVPVPAHYSVHVRPTKAMRERLAAVSRTPAQRAAAE